MVTQVQEKPEVALLKQWLDLTTKQLVPDAKVDLWLPQVREKAAAWVQELAIPTKQDEDWRFTDLSPLLQVEFQAPTPVKLDQDAMASLVLPEAEQSRVVFVNGVYAPSLSSLEKLDGVFVGNLGKIPEKLHDRVSHYLARQQGSQDVFTALNTAALRDVAVVWVAKNKIIETPIHLLLISTAGDVPVITQPRVLVVAEPGSAATLIEHYGTVAFGCSDVEKTQPYLTNTVTEIWIEENAELKHTRVQRDAGTAFHIGRSAVSQDRNSRYTCNAISLGAKLSRHTFDIYQTGEGTDTTLNGLTFMSGTQLADTHSALFLNHPHGVYNQVHKCILDDQAQGVFNGRVVVPQTAQLTNANQLSRNLLLSSKARINTKPQLEIVADDVKCSHGATVSQLEEDEIFYLRSRGLDEETSRHLLIDAFATDILNKLPLDSLQQMLSRCVSCRTL